jgi:multicomponent Na+:H+ antiporter subunit D
VAQPALETAKVFMADPHPADWLVILPVVLLILSGAVQAAIRRRIDLHPLIAGITVIAVMALDAALLAKVIVDGPVTMVMGRWLPPFGIAFTVDVAGALLGLAAAVVAGAAMLHASADIDANRRRYGFYPLLMFLLAGVTGAFFTGDVFNLYVWFEVLLISSFGLIILGGERIQLDGAMKYGLLNLVGTTLFLIATGYLYAIFGTLNMADIAARVRTAAVDTPLLTLAVLYFTAFAMKAAAFPVNFWLPAAYHTPPATISGLFAGMLTKVGIYAMIRVLVMLLPLQLATITPLISAAAVGTMLAGAIGALGQSDIRRAIGFWVVSGIGTLLSGIAIGSAPALGAVLFYMLHSMVVMTALYLMAGMAGQLAGSFAMASMGGLARRSGLFAAMAGALLLAVAGMPPLSGFWPKALLVRQALATGHGWLAATILVSSFLVMLSAGRIFLYVFWRPSLTPDSTPGRLPAASMAAIGMLAVLSLLVGLWPEPITLVTRTAAESLLAPEAYLRSVFPEVKP